VIIDHASPVYPYLQIAGQLREQIADGTITGMLPSYTKLQEDSGMSPGTVQRAVKVLVDEGLVFTVRGRGTFVRQGAS
jgi:DNA-binding GntR family transcriptional regulator